ncbi:MULTISPECIES: glycosyltransferase [unclassified Acinetobacter]|uniref:glycosyltransferase n=1 Tax=unclassified Acinetobacter TaxID=196816 RepID=UPI0008CADFC3|nr:MULTISPECIES: glycosyltransferase [unclassified Acinetobacter]SEM01976.1 Glycosyltransferase involved in cell wall bisynthesis [Acinetobacter sp. DSM 11652]
MNIVIANMSTIPVFAYGGTERVIWDLAKKLVEFGHKVTFIVPKGSTCDFAEVIEIDPFKSWSQLIPENTDIVHFQFQPKNLEIDIPYVVTEHGNAQVGDLLDRNTIFVSKNHAERHQSNSFVYNGLDWSNYGNVNWKAKRDYYHFLGKAAWRLKNVKGAINVALKAKQKLDVLGGDRFNFKRGIRLTFSPNIRFHGMVGGQEKLALLNGSKGLIFPVRWHEPFGLAIIESMYFGCPVFSTPYGAIPELVPHFCGKLSPQTDELVDAILNQKYDPLQCHEHVKEYFNAEKMMYGYLEKYQMAVEGKAFNYQAPSLLKDSTHLDWH